MNTCKLPRFPPARELLRPAGTCTRISRPCTKAMNKNAFDRKGTLSMRNILLGLLAFFVNTGLLGSLESPSALASGEILLSRFPGAVIPTWCGDDALVVCGQDTGLELMTIRRTRRVRIGESLDVPHGCSFDGKWVVYEKGRSSREDAVKVEDIWARNWTGTVVDVYRYEVAMGRRQRFASSVRVG